ncbi:MAG: hypothetical protein ACO1N0_00625 [Fluviicola sp.]
MEDTYLDINGFYEPNWFIMYISGISSDLNLDFDRFDDRQKGLYIHEYGHYLQNITTLSGVLNANEYYKFTHNLRARSQSLDQINLPLNEDSSLISEYEKKRRERFRIFKGDNYGVPNIVEYDRFDTHTEYEIEDELKGTLKVGFYKNNQLKQEYNYGNLAVKEGMSRALQTLFDKNPDHPFYPYKITQFLIDNYCPKISKEPLQIAAICSLALNFENAGHHFFRLINKYNNSSIDMIEFIEDEISQKLVITDGTNLTVKELLIRSIEELRKTIHSILGSEIGYIDDLIDNIIKTEKDNGLVFYNVLSDSKLSLIEKLDKLKGYYGVPLIQLENFTWILPVASTTSGIAEELIEFVNIKALLDRLFEQGGRKSCRFLPLCETQERFVIDRNCSDKQWLREEPCAFTQILDYWKIKDKMPV